MIRRTNTPQKDNIVQSYSSISHRSSFHLHVIAMATTDYE